MKQTENMKTSAV